MVRVNFTIEFQNAVEQLEFELMMRQRKTEIKDLKIMPDTTDLYEKNEGFRKLCKAKKLADNEYRNFLNKL